MSNDPNVGIPVIPRLLTIGLLFFIGYIYFTDYKKATTPQPQEKSATLRYLLAEDDVKDIEFVSGKTTISLDKEKIQQLSKQLDSAFEQDLDVFEVQLNDYEPGNKAPAENN